MAHSSNEYMKEYLKTQRDKARAFDEAMSLMGDFLKDRLANNYSTEQALAQFWQTITPPEAFQEDTLQPEQTQPCTTATESALQEKPECFGKKFHKDSEQCTCQFKDECYTTWVHDLFKPQAQKDAERNAKIYALIQTNKDILRKSELQNLIEIGTIFQAAEEKRQKQLDALTKKYTDRGVPEKTARESAVWEQKQIENAEARKRMKAQHDWDLMSPDEQTAYTRKVVADNKKLLEGSK